jgi:hypothetical protein
MDRSRGGPIEVARKAKVRVTDQRDSATALRAKARSRQIPRSANASQSTFTSINATATMLAHKQAIEDAKIQYGNGKNVKRRDDLAMVVEEGRPALRVAPILVVLRSTLASCAVNWRISALIFGRPGWRNLDSHRQNAGKPARCDRTLRSPASPVSGTRSSQATGNASAIQNS